MRKRTAVLWKKILIWAVGVACVFGVGYIYFKTNVLTIYHYEIIGVPEEQRKILDAEIQTLSHTPLYKIIPTNKLFTYRGLKIKALIIELLPNTESITIRAVPLHTLKITVTPYTPIFSLGNGRAITKEGYEYTEIHDVSTLPLFSAASSSIITENIDGIQKQKLQLTSATNTGDFLDSLNTIIPKINTVLFPVTSVNVDGYGDIFLSSDRGAHTVKLTSGTDMDKQWSNVISAIDTEPLKGLLETEPSKLEYLDVRFGNKVFYKFTKSTSPDSIPTHATSTSQ